MEPGEICAETRQRISDLAPSLSAEEVAAKLPTCPEWSTRDVIGHMTGLVVDVREKKFEGAGTPPWTRAQVAALDWQGDNLERYLTAFFRFEPPEEDIVE